MRKIDYLVKLFFMATILVMIFFSCKNKDQNNSISSANINKHYIPTLDISSALSGNVMDKFTWNSISENVDFIPLETSNHILLSDEASYPVFVDCSLIIISDLKTQRIYCFSKDGKIINHFEHVGNGPGEYTYLTHIVYDKVDSVISVFDNGNQKIISYNIKGNLLKSVSTKDKFYGNIKYISNEKIIVREALGNYQVSIYNKDLNLIKQMLPFPSSFSDKMKTALFLSTSSTSNKNMLLQIHNDTVFAFSDTLEVPIMVLKKGKHKMQDSQVTNFIQHRKNRNDFITIVSIDCFSGYALIKFSYDGYLYINLWDIFKEKLICNFISKDILGKIIKKEGITYKINNRTSIDILPNYIDENKIVFLVPASDLLEEFTHLNYDSNPVLMQMTLE